MPVRQMQLPRINVDPRFQKRSAGVDPVTVQEYKEQILEQMAADGRPSFPPLLVYAVGRGAGVQYYLVDGFHRYPALLEAGVFEYDVEVVSGSLDEADLRSATVNTTHGKPLSREDKRKAVLAVLDNPIVQADPLGWSDRRIARWCGVSHPFVAALRRPKMIADTPLDTDEAGNVTALESGNITSDSLSELVLEQSSASRSVDVASDVYTLVRAFLLLHRDVLERVAFAVARGYWMMDTAANLRRSMYLIDNLPNPLRCPPTELRAVIAGLSHDDLALHLADLVGSLEQLYSTE